MTTELRILTVRQPWAWAIIHGGKDVENRPRNIAGSYRGPVAIHAGLRYDDGWASDALADAMNNHAGVWDEPQPWRAQIGAASGAIIGVVDLVDVHKCAGTPTPRPRCYEATSNGFTEAVKAGTGLCSPWADQFSENHLVLANPRLLAVPIPYRGALGLRRLDADMTAQINAQIGA